MERGLNKIRRPSLIEGKTPRWASRLTPVGLRLRRWAVWKTVRRLPIPTASGSVFWRAFALKVSMGSL
jgi:hypothetical protein